jgi:hypothetical protein
MVAILGWLPAKDTGSRPADTTGPTLSAANRSGGNGAVVPEHGGGHDVLGAMQREEASAGGGKCLFAQGHAATAGGGGAGAPAIAPGPRCPMHSRMLGSARIEGGEGQYPVPTAPPLDLPALMAAVDASSTRSLVDGPGKVMLPGEVSVPEPVSSNATPPPVRCCKCLARGEGA